MIGVPYSLSEQFSSQLFNCICKRNQTVCSYNVAHTLISRGFRTIFCNSGTGEPAFIDSSAFSAKCILILRMEFDTASGNAECTGNPGRSKAEYAVA